LIHLFLATEIFFWLSHFHNTADSLLYSHPKYDVSAYPRLETAGKTELTAAEVIGSDVTIAGQGGFAIDRDLQVN
jgi:hypothetical protein